MSSPLPGRPRASRRPAPPARRGGRRRGAAAVWPSWERAVVLGSAVTERLLARTPPAAAVGRGGRRCSALDAERGPAQRATWRVGPLDDPATSRERLRGADVVVLLAAPTDLRRGARRCPPPSAATRWCAGRRRSPPPLPPSARPGWSR